MRNHYRMFDHAWSSWRPWSPCWRRRGAPASAQAQSAAFQTLPTGASINMAIPLFKSRVVVVDAADGAGRVGNPDVADIVVINPTQLYVLAKDIGTTNVLFWGRDNRLIGSINLEVVHDLDGLKAKLHQLLPEEPIEVYSAQRSIILHGRASNISAMNAAVRIAEGYLAQIQTAKKAQEFEQESASTPRGQVGRLGHQPDRSRRLAAGHARSQGRGDLAHRDASACNARFNAIAKGVDGAFGGVNGGARFPDVLFAPDDVRLPPCPATPPGARPSTSSRRMT